MPKPERRLWLKECNESFGVFSKALISFSGVGAIAEFVANMGSVSWTDVSIYNATDFYCWDEKVRWIITLSLFSLLGCLLYSLYSYFCDILEE